MCYECWNVVFCLIFGYFSLALTTPGWRSGSFQCLFVDRLVHKGLGVIGAAFFLGLQAGAVVSISGNHGAGVKFLQLSLHLGDFLGPTDRNRLSS